MKIDVSKGMINRGNWRRIQECMKKAEAGEEIVCAFLGGSITQGCLSSVPETCYAYLVYSWWKHKFPQAKVKFINAGVGGTSSQYGVARVHDHVLRYHPDFLLIEFAVNDLNTSFYQETYEGLIRATYMDDGKPAVLLMNNVYYDTGRSAHDMHLEVAKVYQLPMVSMKTTIYQAVLAGDIQNREITQDDLHPNDAGHRLVADVIIDFLEKVYESLSSMDEKSEVDDSFPNPITPNAYEQSILYQNRNCEVVSEGFVEDLTPQEDIREIFRNGWTGTKKGDKICFTVPGTGVAVQYRKSVLQPTPIAKVVVDGREDLTMLLDGNFEEDWGDCLYIDTVAAHIEDGIHQVEITIEEAHENDVVPFYLVSVIGSK